MNTRDAKQYVKKNMTIYCIENEYPYCGVMIQVKRGHISIMAAGESVCSPEDEWDMQEGIGIAFGRAIRAAAKQLIQIDSNVRRKKIFDKETREMIEVHAKVGAARKRLEAAQGTYIAELEGALHGT